MNPRPPLLTSKHALIAEMNARVYQIFPPRWRAGSWQYGNLYYLGDQRVPYRIVGLPQFLDPYWMLEGMTPVGTVKSRLARARAALRAQMATVGERAA